MSPRDGGSCAVAEQAFTLYGTLLLYLVGFVVFCFIFPAVCAMVSSLGSSRSFAVTYHNPATSRAVARAHKQSLQEFERAMRSTALDDARMSRLFQNLGPADQARYQAQYEERARQARAMTQTVRAQKEAIKSEAGLAEEIIDYEALRQAIKNTTRKL
jgi:hypothetical protein